MPEIAEIKAAGERPTIPHEFDLVNVGLTLTTNY